MLPSRVTQVPLTLALLTSLTPLASTPRDTAAYGHPLLQVICVANPTPLFGAGPTVQTRTVVTRI